ncbi:MAG TPA: hypothetical protein VMU81_06680 [Acetobacteraceae bacterium]|nr:hypothetical protein [Acetobacteraceae bacterium]
MIAAWPGSHRGRLFRWTAFSALLAMFLLGHQIEEMFFWPMGAAAYLIALGAIVLEIARVITGGIARPQGRPRLPWLWRRRLGAPKPACSLLSLSAAFCLR